MNNQTVKFECTVNDEWQASYALTQKNIDLLYELADLLQLEENDEIDLYDVRYEMMKATAEANL